MIVNLINPLIDLPGIVLISSMLNMIDNFNYDLYCICN